MKLPEGRGLFSAALACSLCLLWGLTPAAAQETSGGVIGEDVAPPARLGPKPKPLRSAYPEAAAPAPAPVKTRSASKAAKPAKVRKGKKSPAAASAPTPARPKLAKEPKAQPKHRSKARQAREAKPPRALKAGAQARPHPRAAEAPAKVSTRAVQQALSRAGYPVPANGHLNKKTRHALRQFQRAHGLAATGQADRPTLVKLGLL